MDETVKDCYNCANLRPGMNCIVGKDPIMVVGNDCNSWKEEILDYGGA